MAIIKDLLLSAATAMAVMALIECLMWLWDLGTSGALATINF
jgi:hypothetical protein